MLTDIALPAYLKDNIKVLEGLADGSVIDLQAIFHELITQLMGRMAYNVRSPSIVRAIPSAWIKD